MIARAAQSQDDHRLRGMAGTGSQRANAALQVGETLFQHIRGRVHNTGIDVAQLFQGKQVGSLFRIFELIAGRLIDRHSPATGGGVGRIASMQLAG